MLTNDTHLMIGPLNYTYAVQKIAIQERKSVEVLDTTRSNRNFIVDSGESSHKAQIRLLFTGLDEINKGVEDNGPSGLRGLIALFKCCPIVSIENKYLSASWRNHNGIDPSIEYGPHLDENKPYSRSDIIPIAIERMELENVPDIPYSVQVTLTISLVNVNPVSESHILYYSGSQPNGGGMEHPKDAYWLKKWLNTLTKSNYIPELSEVDFDSAVFSWYSKDAVGRDKVTNSEEFTLHLNTSNKDSEAILISESCTVDHKFAYNQLLGGSAAFASHMGTTARTMSMDIVFNNQKSDKVYKDFCRFKQTSDKIIKTRERFDRVSGWHIRTPISKLLGVRKGQLNAPIKERPWEGVFVPMVINSESSDQPNLINCRIDLIENNVDFYSDNEIILTQGGTDIGLLRKFYDKILSEERKFRLGLLREDTNLADKLKDLNSDGSFSAYNTFWPIGRNGYTVDKSGVFSLLNRDTLRAVFLDNTFDSNSRLRNALLNSTLATGKLIANDRVTVTDKVSQNFGILWQLVFGINSRDPDIINVYTAVQDLVREKFLVMPAIISSDGSYDPNVSAPILLENERKLNAITETITVGLLGDTNPLSSESVTGVLLEELSRSDYDFSSLFKDALFRVITERKGKPNNLPYVYDTNGVYSAFHKLITAYTLEKDATITQNEAREELINKNRDLQSRSLYPDLALPTYIELYGPDVWKDFAPSIDDLGIDSFGDTQLSRDQLLAVQEKDIVSPAAWFYIKRVKNEVMGLRGLARETAEIINNASPDLSISMPFNTEELDDIKQLINQNNEEKGMIGAKTNKTLSEIIKEALYRYSTNSPNEYKTDLTSLLSASDRFEEGALKGNGTIKVYLHHNTNYGLPREVNIPGLGAEIYRVANLYKEFRTEGLANLRKDADGIYTTPFDKSITYQRNLNSNTKKLMDSCLDQIPDDQYSPERMFPAIKVFLIDRRGDDLVADDSLFSVNAIVSVDVTQDKQDAPLAVIKIADPLYTLQNDYFDKSNIANRDSYGNALENNNRKVLGSLRSGDSESNIKRYKLMQGRSVQIRMGYSSMAYNLPIVFTGRITEIVPGDQLTIVAQGWKAELINRKVNFYNDDAKNWGARDLAIQAITYANPDGFGDRYPEFDAKYILRNINSKEVSQAITNSISNGQNIDLENVGTRTIKGGVNNWINRLLGLRSTSKRDLGFDTRLKNIWYPDTGLYNNVLGLRSFFQVMPSWTNDSWIVPLQPAWDALQEAARHAWNCIVDVVPYDNEATIFMGHPDQPYIYTKGTSLAKSFYNKYKDTQEKKIDETMSELLRGFLASQYFSQSEYYSSEHGGAPLRRDAEVIITARNAYESARWLTEKEGKYDRLNQMLETFDVHSFPSLKSFVDIIRDFTDKSFSASVSSIISAAGSLFGGEYNGYSLALDKLKDKIAVSGLPSARLLQVQDLGIDRFITTYLFCTFYGLDIDQLALKWYSAEKDISEVLSRGTNFEDFQVLVKDKLDAILNRSNYDDSLISDLDAEIVLTSRGAPGKIRFGSFQENAIKYLGALRERVRGLKNQELNNLIDSYIVYYSTDPARRQNENKKPSEVRIGFLQEAKRLASTSRNDLGFSYRESILGKLQIGTNKSISDLVADNILYFKAFVYFFSTYVIENPVASQTMNQLAGQELNRLPPNMKVFRVHHYADDEHNIIQNNIVATTREMWNTVVIEHPSPGSAENTIASKDQLYTQGRINAGANWVYYPKQEVTGVIGLQFHPGLTLSNKKVQVFTELNCQSPDLAAKLACTHLAHGIQKMYRGSLLQLGKHIKPHDRIILGDKYTKMSGPVEVESVVHHWNAYQGWVTNITPNAVCDANPGAAILQTAAMEATYQGVFNTLEFLSDAIMWATIVATLGAATPLAVGEFGVKKGIVGIAKRLLDKGFRGGAKETAAIYATAGRQFRKDIKAAGTSLLTRGQSFNALRGVYKNYLGPATSLLKNELMVAGLEFGVHTLFKANVIAGFVESTEDVNQLPVILSPILYNGNPFTAGLETEDAIWAISAFGLFYSAKQMAQGAGLLLDELFED